MAGAASNLDLATAPRWKGQPGRLEVWYATATDRSTGTGIWIHGELVAPVAGEPYTHGWAAVFPPESAASYGRFGPATVSAASADWLSCDGARIGPSGTSGAGGGLSWELTWKSNVPPLWTFPRWAWRRNTLPAAQVLAYPSLRITGRLAAPGMPLAIDAVGAVAHIYGHGNAERWAWLHAEFDDGALLEVVTAVSRRPGMRRLPPLAFVQLRRPGCADWPRNSLVAAPLFRTRMCSDAWSIAGVVGRHRLRVNVQLPSERCVSLEYTDPDGAKAICTNSERADVSVTLERWSGGWRTEQQWQLARTAHAEIGTRT